MKLRLYFRGSYRFLPLCNNKWAQEGCCKSCVPATCFCFGTSAGSLTLNYFGWYIHPFRLCKFRRTHPNPSCWDKKNFSTAAPLLQAAIFPRHFYYFSAQKFAPFVIYPSLIRETNNAVGAYWKSIPPICFGWELFSSDAWLMWKLSGRTFAHTHTNYRGT